MFKYARTILSHENWLAMQMEALLLFNLEGSDESSGYIGANCLFQPPEAEVTSMDGGT